VGVLLVGAVTGVRPAGSTYGSGSLRLVESADDLPQLIIGQLAEQLNVSVRRVRRLVGERRVPYLTVGTFARLEPAEIAVWLDRSRIVG
jgi:excisionase family DNA binding protein